MATPQYPLINGALYDWPSVTIKADGLEYIGIKEVSYKETKKPTKIRGTHMQPIGRSRGQYEAEGSITMWMAEGTALLKSFGDGYLEKSFLVVIQYVQNGLDTITDSLVGCQISSIDDSHSEGPDGLVLKFELDVMSLKRAGFNPLLKMLGGTN